MCADFFYFCQFVFFDVVGGFFEGVGLSQSWFFKLLISYMSISLVVNFFAASIEGFFRCLAKGGIDPLVVKPVSMWVLMLLRECRPSYLIVLVCCWVAIALFFPEEIVGCLSVNLAWWVVSLFVGVAANIAFLIVVNSFTFLGQRELPVDYIHSELSYFALVPVSILSPGISVVVTFILPMVVCASYSATVLSEGVTASFPLFVGVVMLHVLISFFLFRLLASRFDGFGG